MRRLTAVVFALVVPAAANAAEPPAKVLDLSSWNLTLPVDTDRPSRPDEIKQPALATFEDPHYFFVNETAKAVVFRAHCGGDTTKSSKYSRCELREMAEDGKTSAAWATDDGVTHTLTMRAAITKTPAVKQHVVCGQIHDADDDLLMIRLEGKKLFVERNKVGDVALDGDYKLGQPFELKIQAAAGRVKVWYDGQRKLDWQVSRDGCYFKAGCYTQSNTDRGDAKDAYGEVQISRLLVQHRQEQ